MVTYTVTETAEGRRHGGNHHGHCENSIAQARATKRVRERGLKVEPKWKGTRSRTQSSEAGTAASMMSVSSLVSYTAPAQLIWSAVCSKQLSWANCFLDCHSPMVSNALASPKRHRKYNGRRNRRSSTSI
jgi:hypothetical protein